MQTQLNLMDKNLNSYKKKQKAHKNKIIAQVYNHEKIVAHTELERYIARQDITDTNIYRINDNALKIINKSVRKKEETDKDNIINSVYKDARRSGKYFYIASMHDDCASDHKDYQGKVYVDRYCYDADALAYAREHGIRTVQWVMRNPVWFITRPNCRHYFKTATLGTIKSGRYYIPHTKVGRKSMQTPRGATLEYLQDRLAMLNQMYAKRPTQMLKHKILKTKLLIDQYKRQQV